MGDRRGGLHGAIQRQRVDKVMRDVIRDASLLLLPQLNGLVPDSVHARPRE